MEDTTVEEQQDQEQKAVVETTEPVEAADEAHPRSP